MSLNPNAQKLVDALRSGEFTQTTGHLRDDTGHCCLGVACEIYRRVTGNGEWDGPDYAPMFVISEDDQDDVSLPFAVQNWLGFADSARHYEVTESLAIRNDNGASFTEIAGIIESEPEGLFND